MVDLPEDIAAACKRFQQGDVVKGIPLVHVADMARPLTAVTQEAARRAVADGKELQVSAAGLGVPYCCILSQTCDVISESANRATIVVAPVTAHADPMAFPEGRRRTGRENEIATIKRGNFVGRVHLDIPRVDDCPAGGYVDLYSATTVEKTLLVGKEPIRPLTDAQERRDFAFRVAHLFDRPAVPKPFDDHVVARLRTFLVDLRKNDSKNFELVQIVEDELLKLDDEDTPRVGTLFFVSSSPITESVQKIFDDWWESIQDDLPRECVLTQNQYKTYDEITWAEQRTMLRLTYWHLSDDETEDQNEDPRSGQTARSALCRPATLQR